jgi:choline transport protein
MRLLRLLAKVGLSLVMGKSFHAQTHESYADSRQSGLPFSTWFTRIRVVDGVPLPVNSIMASLCICVIIALLNLVSDRVFNSIIGLLTGALGLTYVLSIGCVLWRRCFGEPLPPARWSLGRWGIPCNIIALLYSILSCIISFFPMFPETTPTDMNWLVSSQPNGIRKVKLTLHLLCNTGPAPSLLSSLS